MSNDETAERVEQEVATAIDTVGSKWHLLILYALQDGELRFNEVTRATGGSSATVSRVFDDLQDADLVERRVEDQPIATYYSLTERGRALAPTFAALREWAGAPGVDADAQ